MAHANDLALPAGGEGRPDLFRICPPSELPEALPFPRKSTSKSDYMSSETPQLVIQEIHQ